MTKPSIDRIIRDAKRECLVLSRGEANVMVDEIVRLRKIEAAARELIGPEGMRLTISDTQRLTVIEKSDKSDPHYRLCTLLES